MIHNNISYSDDELIDDDSFDVGPFDKNEIDRSNQLLPTNILCNTFIKKLSDRSYDGVDHIEVRKYLNQNKKYIQAECCGLYFSENAFCHAAKGFSIPGMITCIHCYIALNTSVYKSDNLKADQKSLLANYIQTFTPYHDEKKCTRAVAYGNCFLCDDILNIVPKQINENNQIILFDKTIIKQSSGARLFTLSI